MLLHRKQSCCHQQIRFLRQDGETNISHPLFHVNWLFSSTFSPKREIEAGSHHTTHPNVAWKEPWPSKLHFRRLPSQILILKKYPVVVLVAPKQEYFFPFQAPPLPRQILGHVCPHCLRDRALEEKRGPSLSSSTSGFFRFPSKQK